MKVVRQVVNRRDVMAAKVQTRSLVLVEPNSHLRTLGLDYELLNTGNQDNDHW